MSNTANRLDVGFFRSAVESNRDCVRVLDLEGRILFLNRAGLLALGIHSIAPYVGAVWADIWPEPGRSQVLRGIEATRRGETYQFEGQCPTPLGVTKWWDVIIAPVLDDEGHIAAVMATSRDIDAMRAVRAQAADQKRHLARIAAAMRAAFRIAQVGSWDFELMNRQVFFSPELCALLGHPPQPDMPLAASLLFWMEEDRPGFQAYLDQVAVGSGRSTFEGRSIMPNGSIKFWRLFCEPEFVEGSCVALHGAAQDITEAREVLERERIALRAADEMSGFLATMSHEIRTPLNGVLGMADVMARGELTPSQRQHLDVIATSGQALLSLLNNLLDLSKIEAGQIKLEDDVVDPRSLAEGAKAMFGALVQGKALVLDLIVEPSAHRTWRGDPKRIGQVVHNLISNAVKFTHHGVVTVTFACEADRLVIRVQDTGIGVPSNRVAYIFDRFVQADASTTRDHGGAGLGLTLCRDLIRLMNGEIGVVSIEGAGAMFTVNLPLAPNPEAAAPADTATAPLDAALRVLVAEDNAINQLVLKTQLSAVGIEPVITGNGQEAVEAWRLSEWDIVLMDIQMPVMDGLTAVQIIREAEQSSGRKRTPILAVTANAMSHHLANYLAAGMDGLIAKPVNMALLLETMDAVLSADEMGYPSPVIGRA